MNQIKKIEILNSEKKLNEFIDKFGFEKCICTVDSGDKSDYAIRLVFYSDEDMFDSITESAVLSELNFTAFGGRTKTRYYVAIEISI